MKNQTQKRAFYVLTGCIAALALCIAAALALLCRTPAAQDVSIPGTRGTIYATVQLPGKLARSGDMPLAVLCHGFTGSRAGDGHFAPLAQELAAQGIATVRLDFPGCGDSTEPFTAYTLSHMEDDVESAILYMQSTYGTGPTALVGHSMGGRLASLYPQQKGGIAALVLWSPANGAGLNGLEFLNIDDFSAVEAMAAEAEAQAIMQVQTALADSLKLLNAAAPNDQVVKLKSTVEDKSEEDVLKDLKKGARKGSAYGNRKHAAYGSSRAN